MSYLARISARATGSRANAPAALPKGLGNRQTAAVARSQETGEEDETLSPMRPFVARPVRRQESDEAEEVSRQEVEDESEAKLAAAPKGMALKVRRQADEEGKEEVAPLRRQEDEGEEEVAPLRRQEDEAEEEVAALRRQEDEAEEEVAPLRRQADEEEPEARPTRIARQEEIPLDEAGQTAPSSTQSDLEPDAEPASQELAGDREPSDLQALHRDISPNPGLSPATPEAQGETPENRSANRPLAEALAPSHPQAPHFTDGLAIPDVVPQGTGADESRPKVVIDRLDVLIQEPAVATDRGPRRRDRERALRARYLRRL